MEVRNEFILRQVFPIDEGIPGIIYSGYYKGEEINIDEADLLCGIRLMGNSF